MKLIDIVRTWPDHEQIKFFAAKWCKDNHTKRLKNGATPSEWFCHKFGQSITDYREEVKQKLLEAKT